MIDGWSGLPRAVVTLGFGLLFAVAMLVVAVFGVIAVGLFRGLGLLSF